MVVGDDMVAVDAYATRYVDFQLDDGSYRTLTPEDVGHIRLAYQAGLGEMDLSKLNVIKA